MFFLVWFWFFSLFRFESGFWLGDHCKLGKFESLNSSMKQKLVTCAIGKLASQHHRLPAFRIGAQLEEVNCHLFPPEKVFLRKVSLQKKSLNFDFEPSGRHWIVCFSWRWQIKGHCLLGRRWFLRVFQTHLITKCLIQQISVNSCGPQFFSGDLNSGDTFRTWSKSIVVLTYCSPKVQKTLSIRRTSQRSLLFQRLVVFLRLETNSFQLMKECGQWIFLDHACVKWQVATATVALSI